MQKKVLAIAVAGALGAPALAFGQAAAGTSTVQIFGTHLRRVRLLQQKPNAAYFRWRTGCRPRNFDYFRTAGSEIGFKGEEQLGGGLAAWFQCASTADIRGSAPGAAGARRNSAVGLKGFFGNVFVGKWDTPYKRTYSIGNVGWGESGGYGNAVILNNGSSATAGRSSRPDRGLVRHRAAVTAPAAKSTSSTTTARISVASRFSRHFQFANGSTNHDQRRDELRSRAMGYRRQYSAGPLVSACSTSAIRTKAASGAGGLAPAVGTRLAPAPESGRSSSVFRRVHLRSGQLGAVWKRGRVRCAERPGNCDCESGVGEQKVSAFAIGFDWNIVGPHGLRGGWTHAGNVSGTRLTTAGGAAGFFAATGTGTVRGLASVRRWWQHERRHVQGALRLHVLEAHGSSGRLLEDPQQLRSGLQLQRRRWQRGSGQDPSAVFMTVQHTF